ncbi:hypothetical protein NQ784_18025 [Acinetobacter baumannii]|nr:hypothetical protein [Acinetobacter baumannii]
MNTRELRVKYNNEWPRKFNFPVEETFLQRVKEKKLDQIFFSAPLSYSDQKDFQNYLGYLLDALDMLPNRPDLAFDNIWKGLDSEFFRVRDELVSYNASRFDAFVDRILSDANTAKSILIYLKLIPYQTCEYAAKRIIEASAKADSDRNAENLFNRAKSALGEDFILKFIEKYPPGSNNKPSPADQRNAGRLLKIIFSGNEIEIKGVKFLIEEKNLAVFLLKVVLANSRNERFHGNVFPPFRSSVARLETYAHAFYLFHISYALLMDVFLYRNYGVIDSSTVELNMQKNTEIFSTLFDGL